MRRARAACIGVGVGIFAFFAFVHEWPRADQRPAAAPVLVIALSSGMASDSSLTEIGEQRLRAAVEVARLYRVPLVTTRVTNEHGAASDVAQRRLLASAGYSSTWTVLPLHDENTHGEALALRSRAADSARIVVVTSPLHTRRACATFERLGFAVTCVAAPQYHWWRMPYSAAYEFAAYLKYRWKGWA